MFGKARDSSFAKSVTQIKIIQEALLDWGKSNYSDFPWRTTQNDFHALVAEIMLQRTKAEQVVPVFQQFSRQYPNVSVAMHEDPAKIRFLLASLGLRWRAEKILQLIKSITENGGCVPSTYKDLIELPGIGHYAASAYLSLHVGIRMPIVDSNVVRLWTKSFWFCVWQRNTQKEMFSQFC